MSIRKLSQLLALMALLAVPFALTSCDDDDWYYDDYWNGYYPDNDNNGSEADQMVAVLSGRWQGDMVYTYTDDNAKPGEKKRVSEKYAVEMTFYRSEDAKDRYAGQGVEVDRNEQGDTQALNFTWWMTRATETSTSNIPTPTRSSAWMPPARTTATTSDGRQAATPIRSSAISSDRSMTTRSISTWSA